MKRPPLCAQRGCSRQGRHAIGWGLSTGVTQEFCDLHYRSALVRLAGLLRLRGLLR